MSLNRYDAKRDANEPGLIKFARQIGAEAVRVGPLDWWIGFRGRWTPTEIKTEKGKYTDAQIEFLAKCRERQLPVWTWRTEMDVCQSLGAKVTA